MLAYPEKDAVTAVEICEICVGPAAWSYAHSLSAEIDDNWRAAVRDNPNFFNGTIHLMDQLDIAAGKLTARLLRTEFKNYLYWRQKDFPKTGVRDGFGSALIQSRDGAYLLGRQRAGNVNAGLAYLPGGFIDTRDVDAAGNIDIAASIIREVAEETGLSAADLMPRPGFIVTEHAAQVSIAKPLDVAMDADVIAARIARHIAAEPDAELEEVVIVRTAADLEGLAMPAFARILLAELLTKGSGAL